MEPVVGRVFSGRVTNLLAFGAIVQLDGLQRRWEGLVHVSQLRREGRVANVSDVVQRNQKVGFIRFLGMYELRLTSVTFIAVFFVRFMLKCNHLTVQEPV